mmetsp:Transcript_10434/g.31001  ORF Transcript_10434/g.31001 Transcript_10434/m.31001 type:complete len:213 (-) Transcript_10434:398-1036(-)
MPPPRPPGRRAPAPWPRAACRHGSTPGSTIVVPQLRPPTPPHPPHAGELRAPRSSPRASRQHPPRTQPQPPAPWPSPSPRARPPPKRLPAWLRPSRRPPPPAAHLCPMRPQQLSTLRRSPFERRTRHPLKVHLALATPAREQRQSPRMRLPPPDCGRPKRPQRPSSPREHQARPLSPPTPLPQQTPPPAGPREMLRPRKPRQRRLLRSRPGH